MPDSRIFMCYRRQDGGDRADRLHDALDAHFRTGEVFIDLFNVPPGVDIRRHITQRLSSCDVLLVVIGPAWLTITDERGQRRLDSETDYVSLEIATTLKGGIPIVPLLVKGAAMPSADELPPGLVRIAELNALALTDGVHWRDDVRRLIATLEQILAARPGSAPAAPPARQRCSH